MGRRVALLGISLLAIAGLASCADTPGAPQPSGSSSGASQTEFEIRAERVAQKWRDAVEPRSWQDGFVPLQALTVPPADAEGLSEAVKHALLAGWYKLDAGMPREAGNREGTIRYPDGEAASVPLITLAQAYAELDQGDPPPCREASVPPPKDAPGGDVDRAAQPGTEPDRPVRPDSAVSDEPIKVCTGLTVTGIRLGTVPLLTSRGEAEVPAWLFTVAELKGAVARVAVAPSAVTKPPEIPTGELPEVAGLVNAQHLSSVEGKELSYGLGVGACDENITPMWHETDDVIVVGGTATRREGVCTDQLLLHPVSITLDEPVGTRPVLDAGTGQVLTLLGT